MLRARPQLLDWLEKEGLEVSGCAEVTRVEPSWTGTLDAEETRHPVELDSFCDENESWLGGEDLQILKLANPSLVADEM